MAFASNYTPLEMLDQKSFAKNFVVRGQKQFEKERWYDHVPIRRFWLSSFVLTTALSVPTVVYKKLCFPSYLCIILQCEYIDTRKKMWLSQTFFFSSHSHFTLFSSVERCV